MKNKSGALNDVIAARAIYEWIAFLGWCYFTVMNEVVSLYTTIRKGV
jgi:hypothetical protein